MLQYCRSPDGWADVQETPPPFFTHTGLILSTLHNKKTFYRKSRLTKYVPFLRSKQFGVTTFEHVTIRKLNTPRPVRPNISHVYKFRQEEELTR
jgi:hypothetical protein